MFIWTIKSVKDNFYFYWSQKNLQIFEILQDSTFEGNTLSENFNIWIKPLSGENYQFWCTQML